MKISQSRNFLRYFCQYYFLHAGGGDLKKKKDLIPKETLLRQSPMET